MEFTVDKGLHLPHTQPQRCVMEQDSTAQLQGLQDVCAIEHKVKSTHVCTCQRFPFLQVPKYRSYPPSNNRNQRNCKHLILKGQLNSLWSIETNFKPQLFKTNECSLVFHKPALSHSQDTFSLSLSLSKTRCYSLKAISIAHTVNHCATGSYKEVIRWY